MASATLFLSNSSLLPKKTVLPSQSAPTPKSGTAFLPPGRSSVIRADARGNNKGNGKGGAVERRRVDVSPLGKSSSDDQKWVHRGLITESLSNGMFKVRIGNGDEVIGYISGKIRKNFIRMLPGDRVEIEVSRYDSTRGRIIYRLSNKDV